MMMMVCEHRAHSWSVSCPSFSRVFFLLSCPLRPYIYTHTPSHHHQLRTRIRIFFSSTLSHRRERARARAAGHNVKVRLFFSFSSSRLFSFALRPYGRIHRRTSLLFPAFSEGEEEEEEEKENRRQRWHAYVIRFRSLNTMTRR